MPEEQDQIRPAVEDALFTYDDYEEYEGGCRFYDCTLSVDIGGYKAGTLIKEVDICYDDSKITLSNEDLTVVKSYELSLTIGKEIT